MATYRKVSVLLAGVLLLMLAGCGKPLTPTPTPEPTPTPTPTPEPTPTPTPVIVVPAASQPIFTNGISFNSGSGNGDVEPKSQDQSVAFTAPAAWTATLTQTKAVEDWLKVEPSSGPAGDVKMTVTAQPNDTYEDRAATVTIKSGEATASFEVKQAGKPRPIEVAEVKLDQAALSLQPGGSATLAATVGPDNATDKTVTWSSSNPAVATVEDGKVTAVAVGEAVITAKAGEKTAECKVTVNPIPVASLALDQAALSLQPGGSATLVATVGPDNATDKTVAWSSSNPAVVTVADGKVTAVAVGEAVITAKAGEKTAECKVTVNPIPVASLALDQAELELKVGESATLVATVGPDNATDKTVTWSSSDPSIATVDAAGKVTAVRTGRATITAQAGDKTATCAVKVPVPAGGSESMGEEKWN